MSTLNVAAIHDVDGTGPKATLPTSGGSAFTLGPNWGAWEFVSPAAIAAVANLSITGIASGYDYLIQLEAYAPNIDANTLVMRMSLDGGSTYKSGASDYSWGNQTAGSGYTDTADTEIEIGRTAQCGNDAGNKAFVQILLLNPGGTGENTGIIYDGILEDAGATPQYQGMQGGGSYEAGADAVDAAQFGWVTNYGTDAFKAQGDITVWRRRRS